jgi:hypothetical protein
MTKTQVVQLIQDVTEQLHADVDRMTHGRGGFTKKTAADIKAGMADGVRNGVHQALAAAGVTIDPD